MGDPKLKPKEGKYSYADYLTWPDEERWEIIDGEVWDMSPAPIRKHQFISAYLTAEIFTFLKGKTCQVYAAPFDVRLDETENHIEESVFNVVQPDLSIICDTNKLDDTGCKGAPDLVIEILSPSTSFKDETHKLNLYEKSGVREYWIINPETEIIMIYLLEGEKFKAPVSFRKTGTWESPVLKGFELDISGLFESL
ncbi:Uma2 family endonuclease [Spirochaeta isovalerica]|uniref:Uma2 family endonuclease n=1 Tax=Spirochaeta isovalerica TaxID=150 RepID=A0A841R6E0_9SPIO|nr:Uma2 family endonuclease [Spirochaeta isovalerica]MBB6480764.1 Uma2 family endonuclease [Spirochaeta isovalerica]